MERVEWENPEKRNSKSRRRLAPRYTSCAACFDEHTPTRQENEYGGKADGAMSAVTRALSGFLAHWLAHVPSELSLSGGQVQRCTLEEPGSARSLCSAMGVKNVPCPCSLFPSP